MTSPLQKSIPPIVNGSERMTLDRLVEIVNLLQGAAADQTQRSARMFELEQKLTVLENKLVHLANAETISGAKTFTLPIIAGDPVASYSQLGGQATDSPRVQFFVPSGAATNDAAMDLYGSQLRLFSHYQGGTAKIHVAYDLVGGTANYNYPIVVDNGQTVANAVSALDIKGGGLATVIKFLPRASGGSYSDAVTTGDAALIFGADSKDNGDFVLAPWNSFGWGLRFAAGGSWMFNNPGSAPSGSYVSVSSPGSTPGLVGMYNAVSRSDLRFNNGSVSIGTAGVNLTTSPIRFLTVSTTAVYPGTDNTMSSGGGANRWTTVYAATGAINTSDARIKTAVSPLSDAELAAAKDLAFEVGTFQFLDAVAEKGTAARRHVGMTVQRAIELMQNHGLDPMAYGFICHDEWDEQPAITDPTTGDFVQDYRAAGDMYSFRTDELLLFISRGLDARLRALEGP